MSAQAVRNYEDVGILPPAERSETGYRSYTPQHAQALRAFLTLRRGHGYLPAREIMCSLHRGDVESAHRLIDAAHVAMVAERRTRTETAAALGGLSVTTPGPAGRPLTVGALAHRLGVHPATLRTWETAGILRPERYPATASTDRTAYATPRSPGNSAAAGTGCIRSRSSSRRCAQRVDSDALSVFLDAWRDRLITRGRDLLAGAAQLDAYLTLLDGT